MTAGCTNSVLGSSPRPRTDAAPSHGCSLWPRTATAHSHARTAGSHANARLLAIMIRPRLSARPPTWQEPIAAAHGRKAGSTSNRRNPWLLRTAAAHRSPTPHSAASRGCLGQQEPTPRAAAVHYTTAVVGPPAPATALQLPQLDCRGGFMYSWTPQSAGAAANVPITATCMAFVTTPDCLSLAWIT